MNLGKRGKRFTVAVLCLVLAGMVTPVLILGEAGSPPPTSAELSALISAAEGSKLYAHSLVDFASSHGISVSSSQTLLSQGDSLLGTAQGDSQAGSVLAGIQAVQAAMKDYTSASASTSLAMSNAGLSVAVGYDVVEQAIAGVNASIAIVASVTTAACAGVASATTGASQACTRLEANITAARANLAQAASLAAQANGQAGASADFSQAMAMVATARVDLSSTQSDLQTVASYGYSQRAAAFLNSVIDPISAQANSTISAEGSANSSFAAFQEGFLSFSRVQATSAGEVQANATALAAAIFGVDTGAVSSSSGEAESVAAQVSSNLSALLSLPAITALPGVVSDINACQVATSSFGHDTSLALSQSEAYTQTLLSAFSGYLVAMDQGSANVQTTGGAYVLACGKVVSDIAGLAAASTIYDNLVGLQISGSVSRLEAALTQELSAMASVQSDISAFVMAVATDGENIPVPLNLVNAAESDVATAKVYLNATGSSAMSQASSSIQAASQAAVSFAVSANASASGTVGAFASSAQALAVSASTLGAKTAASAAALSSAAAYLGADLQARVSARAVAQGDVAAALQLFSEQDVGGGASAIAQAYLEFQSSSATG